MTTSAASYTLEGRLPEFLQLQPVQRGSLWHVREEVWRESHPGYAKVINRERAGHFGLALSTLDAGRPEAVNVAHGHSSVAPGTAWYHVPASGLTREEPQRLTHFDAWHRYPIAWRAFFSERVSCNLDKSRLCPAEQASLDAVEARIRQKTTRDYERALREYRRHPAWRDQFLPPVPEATQTTPEGAEA